MDTWTRDQTLALLKEYEKHPLLYKVKHKEYFMPSKRAEAFQIIANNLQSFRTGVSPMEVKTKIKVVRQQFRIEKKKIDSCVKSGKVYKSSLWCFPYMNFLLNANDHVKGTSMIEPDHEEVSHEDYNSSSEASGSHKSLCSPKTLKSAVSSDAVQQFRNAAKNALDVMSNFLNATAKPKTKQQLFCEFLSMELQEIKLDSTYDSVTSSILVLVRNAKAGERKSMQHGNMSTPMTTVATIPYDSNIQNLKNEIPTEADQGNF